MEAHDYRIILHKCAEFTLEGFACTYLYKKHSHNQTWIWCIVDATHAKKDLGTRMQRKMKYHVKMIYITYEIPSKNEGLYRSFQVAECSHI